MPSKGNKANAVKAKAIDVSAGKADDVSAGKAVEISAGSENGMLADEAVLPPNFTEEDIMNMLNKLLELSLLNEKSSQDNTRSIAIKDNELDNAKKKIKAGPMTQSQGIMNKLVELQIKQLETTISALSETKDKLDVESKCIKEALDKVSKLPSCQQKPYQQPTTVDFFQEIIRGITAEKAAEKAAIEKAVADNIAIEKAVAEKVATEKLAAEKVATEKAAADKAAAEKVAKAKVAAEKLAADKAVADKVAAKKAVAKAKANAEPKTMVEFTVGGNPGMWKQAKCMYENPHDGNTCKFRHPSTDCPSFCSKQYDWTCNNADCDKNHIQPIIPPCRFGKTCYNKNCKFDH